MKLLAITIITFLYVGANNCNASRQTISNDELSEIRCKANKKNCKKVTVAKAAKSASQTAGRYVKSAVTPFWVGLVEYAVDSNPEIFKNKKRNMRYHGK